MKRDEAYKAYLDAYQAYYGTPSTTMTKGRNTLVIDNVSFSYGCFGSKSCQKTFGSPADAMTGHWVACQVKPHKSQQFGWYSCQHSSCPKPQPHWRLCPGICGKLFAPTKVTNSGIGPYYLYFDNFPHRQVCRKRVYDGFWNVITNLCFMQYDRAWYTCEHSSCPHSSKHFPRSSATLSPSNNSYVVSAGGTHTATLSVPSGYREIYWYLKSPSQSGLGTSVSNVLGNSSSSTASHTYSFPRGMSGDYVLTAYITLSDNTIAQPSYTVTVR